MVRDMLMFWKSERETERSGKSQGNSLKFLLKKIKLFAIFCHFSAIIFPQFQEIKIRKIKIWKIISLRFDKIIPLTLRKAFLPWVAVRKCFSNKRPQHRCFPVNIKNTSDGYFYLAPRAPWVAHIKYPVSIKKSCRFLMVECILVSREIILE